MLSVVDNPSRWLREHPLEVAIVILTPPFLPATMQAARVFRLLRLLRLLKLAKLTRRLLSTEGVRDAAVLALLSVLGGGAAFVVDREDRRERHAERVGWRLVGHDHGHDGRLWRLDARRPTRGECSLSA